MVMEMMDCEQAADSEKCTRIGDEHNDLNLIGLNSNHNTLFDMPRNWSSSAYNQKETCTIAWQLFTSAPHSVDLNQLSTTYFDAVENFNSSADGDDCEIWLELGHLADLIILFGTFLENSLYKLSKEFLWLRRTRTPYLLIKRN